MTDTNTAETIVNLATADQRLAEVFALGVQQLQLAL